MSRRLRRACSIALIAWGPLASADQYRSEVREVPNAPATTQTNPQALLQQTTDPYARALLLRDLAAQAAQNKDYARAAQWLEQAIAQKSLSGPAESAMRRDLAQLYMATGNTKQMLPQLEAEVRSGKATPEVRMALGAAYLEQKRYAEALPLVEAAMRAVPNPDPSWKQALLAAYLGVGRDRDALPLLEESLRANPAQRERWMQLAAVSLRAKDYERAQATMEIASRLGYLSAAEDRLRLVTLTSQIGAPFEAASLLQGWMERKLLGDDAGNRQLLAKLWLLAREKPLALSAIDRALALESNRDLMRQKAQLLLGMENYPAATAVLEKLVAQKDVSGTLWLTLGTARYQQADIDGAAEAFQAAQGFDSSRKQAEEWLRYLQSDSAREQAMLALRDQPNESAGASDGAVGASDRLMGSTLELSASADSTASSAASRKIALTPIGAEAAANADGSIPAWNGGISRAQWPAGFEIGQRLADVFAADQPVFVIDGRNADQYTNRLSSGHRWLLAHKPGYRMPVFTTRRSVGYPKAIYEASQANLDRAKLTGTDSLTGARLGVPFSKPENGVEVLWNHRTRYRGDSLEMQSTQAVVQPGGRTSELKQLERVLFRYGNIANPADLSQRNILLYYLSSFGRNFVSPDFVALVHETADATQDARNVWAMPTDMGRLFRIPPVGYDQPFPGSDGLYFIDMVDMYNGALDRYVWKLLGKRELYIPYNNYRIGDGRYRYSQLLTPGFLNPEATRYELHRVWVVEATERPGRKHSFGKRVFYVDEDSWNIVLVENYDRDNSTLW
jgi:tetratricopeptide (TPR) repeat protein